MGFDLLIGHGERNRLVGDELASCLVEVRIEQSLDRPTKFGIRFLDDIADGEPVKPKAEELALDRLITIALRAGESHTCLCRGPIVRRKSELTLGGPGSWFEVQGIDRRDLLARTQREGAWVGKPSDVARTLLSAVYSDLRVQTDTSSEKSYDAEGGGLAQRGTDLELLEKTAAENGYHLWIDYEDVRSGAGDSISVKEVANWRASPTTAGSTGSVLSVAASSVEIKLNVMRDQCPNVTRFQIDEDGTRPSEVRSVAMNASDGSVSTVDIADSSPAMGGKGRRVSEVGAARFLPATPKGDPHEQRNASEAALKEAAFFVKAEVATTEHLLAHVLQPHQVVSVRGIGTSNEGTPFRVAEVKHVINGAGHYMDARLETNVQLPSSSI